MENFEKLLYSLRKVLEEVRRPPSERERGRREEEEEEEELGVTEEQNRLAAEQIYYSIMDKVRWKKLKGDIDEGVSAGRGYYIDVPVEGRGLGLEGGRGVGRLIVEVTGSRDKKASVWIVRPAVEEVITGEKFRGIGDIERVADRIANKVRGEL